MKTFTKVILILASVFIVIGLVSVIVAVSLGAKIYDNYPYETYNFSDTYTDVTSLNIRIGFGKVIVKEGQEFKVDATNVIKDRFNSFVTNGVWTIEENNKSIGFSDFFFGIARGMPFINYSPKITIYVPKNFKFDKSDITIGTGEGTIEVLNTKNIDVNVGTGSLIINNLNSEGSNIDCGVGSININGTMIGYNKLKNGVGDIKLNLVGNEKDYNYKYTVGIGDVSINNSKYSKGSTHGKIDNDATNDFDIDCGVGSIEIKIEE